jgi:Domain of unknown function (DUF4926)
MKPEEYDVVRLRRSLPEHDLPAGAKGTVVIDYTKFDYAKYTGQSLRPAYEVEFADAHGVTHALVTIYEDDLEVVPPSALD